MLQILNTGIQSAEYNMRLDETLLNGLEPTSPPLLHLYQWANPSATYGYFICPEQHLDLKGCAKWGLDLARRPTGGGIVFHLWDLAFSFLLPASHFAFSLNPLDNYLFVNGVVQEVVKTYFKESADLTPQNGQLLGPGCEHFCMAKPTQYDVVYQGRKIAGAAQRKRKQGYLHQGTIALARPQFDLLQEVLLSKQDVLMAMKEFTFAPLAKVEQETREAIENLLADKLREALKF